MRDLLYVVPLLLLMGLMWVIPTLDKTDELKASCENFCSILDKEVELFSEIGMCSCER